MASKTPDTKALLALATSFAAGAGAAWSLLLRRRRRADQPFARARVVPPPHPDWLPPQRQPMPAAAGDEDGDKDAGGSRPPAMIEVDPSSTPKAEVYALCISAVVPRPIALVSSIGPGAVADGTADESKRPPTVNVAPYSYFNILSHDPPTVGIGMCRSSARGGARKDSFANIEATG
jgi:hypothetical protein